MFTKHVEYSVFPSRCKRRPRCCDGFLPPTAWVTSCVLRPGNDAGTVRGGFRADLVGFRESQSQLCIIHVLPLPGSNKVHLPRIPADIPKLQPFFLGFEHSIFLFSSSKFTLPNYKLTGAFKRNSDGLTRSLFIEQSSGNILSSKLQIFSSSRGMEKELRSRALWGFSPPDFSIFVCTR